MVSTYFKRYRMETDVSEGLVEPPGPPTGYRLLAWDAALLEAHADAKYLSFRNELDATVFPCLGERDGCLRLMREIAAKPGFLPDATWLAAFDNSETGRTDYVGTIQGIETEDGQGSIQNLGVVPLHRGCGLGTCLLRHALEGFRRNGLRRVSLEVTADNHDAIRIYRNHGFRTVKTVFKSAEVAYL
ncbi:MAG TPA: GNAT family N-acetyltransferase [Planctomycetaceae bacterium]|nr:GNAT family N-acetyltransferase [Planctomycetaceae bacterium]